MSDPTLLALLIEKYGKPYRTSGAIKKVTCQNSYGAKFDRVEGKMWEYWREKNGIQAALVHRAHSCAESAYISYQISHTAIKNKIASGRAQDGVKDLNDRMDKIKKGI